MTLIDQCKYEMCASVSQKFHSPQLKQHTFSFCLLAETFILKNHHCYGIVVFIVAVLTLPAVLVVADFTRVQKPDNSSSRREWGERGAAPFNKTFFNTTRPIKQFTIGEHAPQYTNTSRPDRLCSSSRDPEVINKNNRS